MNRCRPTSCSANKSSSTPPIPGWATPNTGRACRAIWRHGDGRVWDFTDRGEGLRNTKSLLGARGVGEGRVHWSANMDEIQDFERDIRDSFQGSGFMSDDEYNARKGANGVYDPLGKPAAGVSPTRRLGCVLCDVR